MTYLTELVARLRLLGYPKSCSEAADALEAQQAEIVAIKARAEAAEAKVARLVEALEVCASSLGWSGAGLAYERAQAVLREIGGGNG